MGMFPNANTFHIGLQFNGYCLVLLFFDRTGIQLHKLVIAKSAKLLIANCVKLLIAKSVRLLTAKSANL